MGSSLPAERRLFVKYAILIDAGFIKKKLGSQASPLTAIGVQVFLAALRSHPCLQKLDLHRVYWYDAPPLDKKLPKPLNGGVLDLGATALAQANTQLLEDLCNSDYFRFAAATLSFAAGS